MKNKQLHFFLLEFTLSLIILSVTLVVALSMFTKAAQMHQETETLRKLSSDMVMTAETLRNPSTEWPVEDERKTVTTGYDVKGEESSDDPVYTLTIEYDTRQALNKATMTLTKADGTIVLKLNVSALTEVPQ